MEILLLMSFVIMVFGLWVMFCNYHTHKQRMSLLDLMIEEEKKLEADYFALSKLYNKVSYDKHMFYLMTFRNPMKLYDTRLQDLL